MSYKIKRICSWCDSVFGEYETDKPNPNTHGVCPKCQKDLDKQALRIYLADLKKKT